MLALLLSLFLSFTSVNGVNFTDNDTTIPTEQPANNIGDNDTYGF